VGAACIKVVGPFHISTVILIELPWRYFFAKAFDFKGFQRFSKIKRVANSHRKGCPLSFFAYFSADKSFTPQG